MAFFQDEFTDTDGTDLAAHTPTTTGTGWTEHANSGGSITINNNRVQNGGGSWRSAEALVYADDDPAGTEYDVEAVITPNSGGGSRGAGIAGRIDTTAQTYYQVFVNRGLGTLYLEKVVTGSYTTLGSVAMTADGVGRDVVLEVRDATKKVFVDTVEEISSTDNAISAAGKVGVVTAANNGAVYLDDFVATDAAAGGETGFPFRRYYQMAGGM